LLHQVGDLFELNVKLRCQKFKELLSYILKMASWQPKHCSCYVLLIKYILYNKAVLIYKRRCFINYQIIRHYMWENRALKHTFGLNIAKYRHFEINDFWHNSVQFIFNMFHIPRINCVRIMNKQLTKCTLILWCNFIHNMFSNMFRPVVRPS